MGVSTSAADYQPPGTSRAAQRAAMRISTAIQIIAFAIVSGFLVYLGALTEPIYPTIDAPAFDGLGSTISASATNLPPP